MFAFLLFSVFFTSSRANQYEPFEFDVQDRTRFLPQGNVTQQTKSVSFKPDCVLSCIDTPWCRSVNFKLTPQADGLYSCESFSVDKFSNERYLQPNQDYIHYSFKVSLTIFQTNHFC